VWYPCSGPGSCDHPFIPCPPGGAAALSGQIHEDDRLVAVDGVVVKGKVCVSMWEGRGGMLPEGEHTKSGHVFKSMRHATK